MKKKNVNVAAMVINAMLAAVYVLLGLFAINLGAFKITVEALPVVISAIAFGPLSAAVVGFLGEFINQLLGPYGLTPTTLLWVLPAVVRGACIGLCLHPLKKRLSFDALFRGKWLALVFVVGAGASVLHSTFNTFAWYVDSKIFGYYNYAVVIGAFGTRLIIGIVTSVALTLAAVPVTLALRKARMI